jgi:osmotically-inducible protein OsmY
MPLAVDASNSVSDSELIQRVHRTFEHHPHLKTSRFRFQLRAGRITIRGRAESYFEKQMAQEAVRSLNGIQSIDNELEVPW